MVGVECAISLALDLLLRIFLNCTLIFSQYAVDVVSQDSIIVCDSGFMPPDTSTRPSRLDYSNYRVGRGETGVLTYEPYKSALLTLWRFRTPAIAQRSSAALWDAFLDYEKLDDFVGMDMSRKFLQMGMTRAKRYANHKGGKKYKKQPEGKHKSEKDLIEVGLNEDWQGRREKEEASKIFKEVWEKARVYEPYLAKKKEFLKRQKEWEREQNTEKSRRPQDALFLKESSA